MLFFVRVGWMDGWMDDEGFDICWEWGRGDGRMHAGAESLK